MKIELAPKRDTKKIIAFCSFIVLLGYAGFALSSKATKDVSASQLRFQTVKQSHLDIYTTAYGELSSAKERLLTAPAQGKVSEILVRPGTKILPETVILTLANPRLEQEVNAAKGQLAQQLAQREAFKFEQQSERLNYQGRIADIEADIERAELELSVNEDLLNLGVSSKIELQRAKLSVKQESKKLEFEKKKFDQFVEMQSYQLTQRDITIEQQQAQVALLEQQLDDMKVKAGISGSLQNLSVELGQSVQLGQSLAKVGSDEALIARLRLPQNQADQIDINAPVIIDTQKGYIKAHINRIESVVSNGTVLAEAILDDALTSNARPALSISAQVFVKHQQNTLHIEQTPGLRPRSKQAIFVRNANNQLQQKQVTFGELSKGQLTITDGLISGDELVTSDINKLLSYQKLNIVD
ncbi:efflux RND transporter periplasmic adaptor subunit [Litorilituus lipolyticus]|uniref:HlyD family efflux transporter periplasmic adaptor subunit n=1 Tax=Litorilituus lipolyticus TaxID=2491017 RepID=A0A502KL27_9GAMM|nr:HlyD family efflux transporter periplasmic adaptor subunit [Litorilituus lipolyticus]TPH12146.1 HlyD family efflux transporter periplasmic adaptor subunit [Litorilituus lipolyticus]